MKRIGSYLNSLRGSAARVPRRDLVIHLALTLVLSGFTLYFQYLLRDLIRPGAFLLLYPLVFLVSLLWGAIPGLVAWIVTLLGANIFLIEPYGSVLISTRSEAIGLGLYAVLGLGIIFSNHYSLQLKNALRDALEQKLHADLQRRRSERVLQKLSDLGLIGIIYFDMSGGILDANDAFLNLLNYSREDLEAGLINWKSLTPERWRGKDDIALEQLASKRSFDPYEKEYLSKVGERVPILLGGGLYADEEDKGAAFVLDLRKQKQMEKIQTELQLLIEKTREFIALCDVNGKVLYLNEMAKAIISPPSLEAISSLKLLELMRPYDFADEKSDLLRSKTLQGEFELEVLMTSPFNNSIVPMRIQSFPIFDKGEAEVVRYAFLGRDLRNEVESADRLRTALDVAQMAIWEYDVENQEYYRSGEHDRLYGFEHNLPEWTDDLFYSLIHPTDEERVRSYFTALIKSDRTEFQILYRIKLGDGEIRWLSARGNVIRDSKGRATRLVGGLMDVSRLKKVESDLKKALRIRDQFISIASHELKTPITSLQLQLELLSHYLKDFKEGKEVDLIEIDTSLQESRAQFRHLTNLVNDLLDVTRIANGKLMLNFEEIDLGPLIENATRVIDTNGSLQIEADGDSKIHVQLDRERMIQVVSNLLTNALKFGMGKPILIRYGKEASEDLVWFEVEDQGLGISEEDIDFIFDRFGQGSSGKEKKGLGLGLYITKEIVKAHGGRISVVSQLHKGSRFRVELPRLQGRPNSGQV